MEGKKGECKCHFTVVIFYSDYAYAIDNNTAFAIVINIDNNDNNISAIYKDNCFRFANKRAML